MPCPMRRGFKGVLLALLVMHLSGGAVQASTWDRIASYLRLLKRAGVNALVARDCPAGLLGAFHEGKQALLMCGNNLPNDPSIVWVVLAHESAHVMQSCHGGNLMPAALLSKGMAEARRRQPNAFQELQLYHTSQHHVEAEARLIQVLPPDQVVAMFEKHCSKRLSR